MTSIIKTVLAWLFFGSGALYLIWFFLGIGNVFGFVLLIIVLFAIIPIQMWIEYDLKAKRSGTTQRAIGKNGRHRMIIGVPKERKIQERRVALTPKGAALLIEHGHTVLVEKGAGEGSGFSDADYAAAGAKIVGQKDTWETELIVKVKEPIRKGLFLNEYRFFKKGLILFTYLHLAPNPELTEALLKSGVTAIDYATVQLPNGFLPLLKPMSEISGRLAVQTGAALLVKYRGLLLGGTSTVDPATVLILGGGTVGTNAAETAIGMGARVIVMDAKRERVEELKERFHKTFPVREHLWQCEIQSQELVKGKLPEVDLLIGAALVPGAKTPHLVTEDMVKTMKEGSVIVDVSIDQGGCVETSRPTNHKHPTFMKHGVIHYCVTNMPGSVPRTSTLALTNETLPYILELADKGLKRAIGENSALKLGVNIHEGKIVHPKLTETLKAQCESLTEIK